MKKGDVVRFAFWEEVDVQDRRWSEQPKSHVGLLIEHDKLMGTAYVLYMGSVHKLRAVFVEKAGNKDLDNRG